MRVKSPFHRKPEGKPARKSSRRWRPILRPRAGRTLPRELRAENVGRLACVLPEGLRDPGFPLLLRRIDEAPVLQGNRVQAFFRGEEASAAVRQAIDQAKSEVLVESYILKDDRTGRDFLDVVARAAERGVVVKVLADAWGSVTTGRDDDTGRALAEAFREDLRGSVEINRERWAGRPLLPPLGGRGRQGPTTAALAAPHYRHLGSIGS